MENIIKSENLKKQFGKKIIFADVSLTIKQGDCIAITGHNGCGKSTLIKILMGLIPYDGGSLGRKKEMRYTYIPEHFPKLPMSARQYLLKIGEIEGIEKSHLKDTIKRLSESFFMEDLLDDPIKTMSKGTKQKIAIMQALLQRPDVIYMDEPLSGLDEDSKKNFVKQIKELQKDNTAVVMICHEPFLIDELHAKEYRMEHKTLREVTKNEDTKKTDQLS